MFFNSLDFAIFLPIVFVLHWFLASKGTQTQNALLLSASYFFYGCWDWRFLSLILFSTVVDYIVGLALARHEEQHKRKLLVLTSICVNLGFLFAFKYFNFFLDNLTTAFSFFGQPLPIQGLSIVLPVGISFYTFQTLSYSIDVYKRKLEPTRDFIAFATFVSFFPQLVAGPIERATHLLPQFYTKRSFNYSQAVDGLRQILWGLFKKVIIADNCAQYVNQVFDNPAAHTGSTLLLGAIFFGLQIYGDFSGYSDMAIGTARLFNIRLNQNFAFPYFSRDIAEFWRRWHISLSTWFRDYVYIPLGGSRGGSFINLRNVIIVFLLSGFWHGANWTFIIWGALNALYFIPLLLMKKHRTHLNHVAENRWFPSLREFFQMLITFGMVTLAWVFFRSASIAQAIEYLGGIFSPSLFKAPDTLPEDAVFIMIGIFILLEWIGRSGQYAIETIGLRWPRPWRFLFYYLIIVLIFLYRGIGQDFIYFQF